MPSSEGVPVDVVGRPSMGEGRTPGMGWVETFLDIVAGTFGASGSAGARESATLRLRNAIIWNVVLAWWLVKRNNGSCLIDKTHSRRHSSTDLCLPHSLASSLSSMDNFLKGVVVISELGYF
jgi:hypothetical protein